MDAGFVDSLPRRDPLPDLIKQKEINEKEIIEKESNEKEIIEKEIIEKESNEKEINDVNEESDLVTGKWKPHETDFGSFPSDSTISLKTYAKHVAAKKKAAQRAQYIEDFIKKSTYLKHIAYWKHIVLWVTGNTTSRSFSGGKSSDQIALLQVDGMIGNDMAGTLVDSIRKIREDDKTKCVVVRVSSGGGSVVACETIQQELKALDIPVVFSFGNVSASGGYYIASFADRIFCSKKTITGSIGVFGIRPDLTGLAAKYGIHVDHVASSELAGINMPFHSMSPKMKQQIANTIDRHYSDFKNIVSDGRHIPIDAVETIAQGRVWTGIQGKENGLIDEVGGLHRAIAYARRTYTSNKRNDGADVVSWPKQQNFIQKMIERRNGREQMNVMDHMLAYLLGNENGSESTDSAERTSLTPSALSGVFMA